MLLNTRCALIGACAVALCSTAHAQKLGFTLSDTAYTDAAGKQLSTPEGVACAADGTIVVADTGNSRLLRYELDRGILRKGEIIGGGKIKHPVRVQATSKSEFLVHDRRAGNLVRIDKNGAARGPVELSGNIKAADVAIGSFALDANDRIYVLDVRGARVLAASATGAVDRVIPLPEDAKLVTDVTVDNAGTIYAVDAARQRIYKVAKTEDAFAVLAEDLSKELDYPTHLATNANRTLLIVTDRNGSRLLLLGLDGSSLGRRLGMGTREGFVYYPSQVCVTKTGAVVVTDRGNDRVQLFGGKK